MNAGATARPLGEVVRLQAGYGFPLALQGRSHGDFPFAKVGDISRIGRSGESIMTAADHYVDAADLERLKAKPIPAGSVLFAKIGEAIRQNHRVVAGRPLLIDNNAMAAVPTEYVDSRYLFHFLRTVDFYPLASSTTVPALRKSELEKLPFPVFPLPQQRRIAEILDKADALRAKRRAAIAQLGGLAQSIFLDMFGDPATNPKGWEVCTVGKYVEFFQGGRSFEADADARSETQNRVLKVSAVTSMRFVASESKPVPDTYVPPKEHFVRAGDLLFSRANTSELVGAVALVERAPENLLLPDKLWRFVWQRPLKVEPTFVWALFQTAAVRNEIGKRATGTSGSMKNISQEKLLEIRTILPPVLNQRKFVDRLQAMSRAAGCFRVSLVAMDALFSSLQHGAFRGRI